MSDSFFVDSFSRDIFNKKYAGKFSNPLDYYKHLAKMVAFGDQALADKFFKLMWKRRFSPGGRILAFAGRPDSRMSLVNCTTHSIEDDSLEEISSAVYSIMRASSRGQGIGIDISKLRPHNAPVNNAARTSTGSISFMEMLNSVGGTIGQEGRRAALLFSISDNHPDLYRPEDQSIECHYCKGKGCKHCINGYLPYDFIHVKRMPGKVENANISVKISDALMRAVALDHSWELNYQGRSGNFPFSVSHILPARSLFSALAKSAHTSAEPGVLYWDTARQMSNSDRFGEEWGVVGLNACVAPDTVILTSMGNMTIGDLSELAVLPQIQTFNEDTEKMEWDTPLWVEKTREDAEVVTITFYNGVTLTCTPDHRILTPEKGWVAAQELKAGEFVVGLVGDVLIQTITAGSKHIDTYDIAMEKNHNFFANGILVHNCTEQVLDQDGVCVLGSLNLSAYVVNPFKANSYFDYDEFMEDISIAVEFLDNIVTLELQNGNYISERQKRSLEYLRRLGLGVMGLADTLGMLGLPYSDSESTKKQLHGIFSTLRDVAYSTSILLAKTKGAAKVWEGSEDYRYNILTGGFFATLPDWAKADIQKYGTRNVAVISIAPTGSISNLLGVSSGIEPLFALEYTRMTRINGFDQLVDYVQPSVQQSRAADLPDSIWQTAYEVSPTEHVRLQALIQGYVDSAISKSCNLPKTATAADVGEIYKLGWQLGLKGISVYVDGSRTQQVLTAKKATDNCPTCGGELIHTEGCTECPTCSWSACSL